jgi:RNA polymerase sigma factor (sigma-70 family)
MAELSEGDRYLLQQISRGDSEGWSQLVRTYQGRLLAFARSRLSRKEEAEDLVQDTFIAFLEGIKRFRENASVETFLFTILRHKLIDFFRGKQMRTCFLQDVLEGASSSSGGEERALEMPDSSPTASWYAKRDENDDLLRASLANALNGLIERLKSAENFRDLQIIEMLFYAQIRNKNAAKMLDMDEKAIALIKHRALKEIREHLLREGRVNRTNAPMIVTPAWEQAASTASLLTEVWEEARPTCPKRSTVGRFMLGTLDESWKQYVDFHVNKLGCQFCRANLDDLKKQTEDAPRAFEDRVMQSTIGFFKK